MSLPPLDCQKCGACCLAVAWGGKTQPFAEVDLDEVKALEKALPGATVDVCRSGWAFEEPAVAMQVKPNGRCVALQGNVGRSVSCSVYGVRPAGCREFEPGSEKCLEIRRERGIK